MPNPNPQRELKPVRLEALSDGIFAIVMTLLIFDLKVPQVPPDQLFQSLAGLWPNFLGYAVTFALLGIYWLGHLTQFQYIEKADTNLVWLNILFYALVALLPFSTRFLGQYPLLQLPQIFYAGNLVLIGFSLYFIWAYAAKNNRLIHLETSKEVVFYGEVRCLTASAGYSIAIIVSFISTIASLAVFALIPFLYILPFFQKLWVRLIFRKK